MTTNHIEELQHEIESLVDKLADVAENYIKAVKNTKNIELYLDLKYSWLCMLPGKVDYEFSKLQKALLTNTNSTKNIQTLFKYLVTIHLHCSYLNLKKLNTHYEYEKIILINKLTHKIHIHIEEIFNITDVIYIKSNTSSIINILKKHCLSLLISNSESLCWINEQFKIIGFYNTKYSHCEIIHIDKIDYQTAKKILLSWNFTDEYESSLEEINICDYLNLTIASHIFLQGILNNVEFDIAHDTELIFNISKKVVGLYSYKNEMIHMIKEKIRIDNSTLTKNKKKNEYINDIIKKIELMVSKDKIEHKPVTINSLSTTLSTPDMSQKTVDSYIKEIIGKQPRGKKFTPREMLLLLKNGKK